jgi:hypothetical protein
MTNRQSKMILQLLVVGALAKGSIAFAPVSLTSSKQISSKTSRSPRHGGVSLRDQILVDPKDSAENSSFGLESAPDESSIFPLAPLTTVASSDATVDEGAQLFLNSILQTEPEDIIAEADETLEYIFSEANGTTDNPPPPEIDTLPENTPVLESFVDPGMTDDLKVVLEASGAAAAAAEASMSQDLLERLEFAPTNASSTDLGLLAPTEQVSEILSVSSVVGERVTAKIEAPEVSKILKFAIPAIGVWLCGPLLSLIDTSAVGILSGTIQQAALNPAVAVTDYAALLIVSIWLPPHILCALQS